MLTSARLCSLQTVYVTPHNTTGRTESCSKDGLLGPLSLSTDFDIH